MMSTTFNKHDKAQHELYQKINCSLCKDSYTCPQIKEACPKVNYKTFEIEDVSILQDDLTLYVINPETFEGCAEYVLYNGRARHSHRKFTDILKEKPNLIALTLSEFEEKREMYAESLLTDFQEITKEEFDSKLYRKPQRCRYAYNTLSFFSDDFFGFGVYNFCFALYCYEYGQYFKASKKITLTDKELDEMIRTFLKKLEDGQTFTYRGWLCRYDPDDALYYLFTPEELENPDDLRMSETEVSSKCDAIVFIDHY